MVVTAYNLYANVYQPNLAAGRVAPAAGSGLMIVVALLLLAAAASATTGSGVGGCPDEEAFAKMRETVRRAHNDWDVPLTFQR